MPNTVVEHSPAHTHHIQCSPCSTAVSGGYDDCSVRAVPMGTSRSDAMSFEAYSPRWALGSGVGYETSGGEASATCAAARAVAALEVASSSRATGQLFAPDLHDYVTNWSFESYSRASAKPIPYPNALSVFTPKHG
jgi:hypothetical protein